jgi:N6-adenosine-specific RNA methylase IME4
MKLPNKKYSIIYADPPWSMGKRATKRVLVPTYPVMSMEDICTLPVSSITSPDCALFLWVINGKLPEGITVMSKWGFRFVGVAFTWIKTSQKTGLPNCRMAGNYTLQGTELCLLGLKGKLPVKNRTVRQVILQPRMKHSEKPKEIRERIVQLFGNLSRIELFARDREEGWDAWGDEI